MKTTRGKVPTSRAVVTSLSRAAQSAKAWPVSDATHRDPRCLSAIISGLALDGRLLEALRLFKWFQTSALDPDEFTLSNALSLSANLSALDQGRQIQALVFKKNLPMDVAATNSLINLYFKCGSIADAEKVFDGMLLRDVYTWNNRNKTSSKTLPRFQKLYSRRKLLSTSSCSPRFIARALMQVSIEEGEGKAQELGVMFIKTSAKAGFNIKLKQTNTCTANISFRFVNKSVHMFDQRNLTSGGVGAPVHKLDGHKAAWFLDKVSIFRRAAEDGFLNIWDYEGEKEKRTHTNWDEFSSDIACTFTNLKYSRVEIDEVRSDDRNQQFQHQVVEPVQAIKICGFCASSWHLTDTCPSLQSDGCNSTAEQFVAATSVFPNRPQYQQSNQPIKYDPMSPTYNLGWRDHPNLRYGNISAAQQPFPQQIHNNNFLGNQRPPGFYNSTVPNRIQPFQQFQQPVPSFQQPRKSFPSTQTDFSVQDMKEIMQQMMLHQQQLSLQCTHSIQQQQRTDAVLQNIERQVSQLVSAQGQTQLQTSSQLPSQTIPNPRGNIKFGSVPKSIAVQIPVAHGIGPLQPTGVVIQLANRIQYNILDAMKYPVEDHSLLSIELFDELEDRLDGYLLECAALFNNFGDDLSTECSDNLDQYVFASETKDCEGVCVVEVESGKALPSVLQPPKAVENEEKGKHMVVKCVSSIEWNSTSELD
ncbi:hypothetical protein ZIOFF_017997 [Zingiber officinale]|uniref:Pentatricopeptide repeat-containing protein n=1 Tax=Zingiber officinale TaxID=94328 RepID=A0A8J5LKG0_ZINOF|nr:hypothetical protein ZIOFF_017997 [Zingiber officinale]